MNQQEVLSLTENQSEAYIFSLESLLKEASEKLGKSLEDFDAGTAKNVRRPLLTRSGPTFSH
jgi:hypothetical protein